MVVEGKIKMGIKTIRIYIWFLEVTFILLITCIHLSASDWKDHYATKYVGLLVGWGDR